LRNYVHRAYILADGDTLTAPVTHTIRTASPSDRQERILMPDGVKLADAERRLILATLKRCGGVKKDAAAMLDISLKTLYNRLTTYAAEGYSVTLEPDGDRS